MAWPIAENADDGGRTLFSAKFACPVSGFTIDEIEPRLFSFNNPHGACPACDGLGTKMYFDPALVVPDQEKSLKDGAIAPWSSSSSSYYDQTFDSARPGVQVLYHYAVQGPAAKGEGYGPAARAINRSR